MGDDLTDLPRDVEIDGLPEDPQDEPDSPVPEETLIPKIEGAHLSRTHQQQEDDKIQDDDEPLQCPRCLAPFSINKHADLLNHINVCME